MSSLHRIILYRLLAAWVVISLLIGVAVSWAGLRRIDRQLVTMATAELRMFAAANLDRLGHPETARAALDQLSAELSRDRFIAGEFQDNMRRKLAATVNLRYSELTMEVARLAVELPLDQDRHFRKFNSNGLGGLRVLVPFRAPDGTPAGYFEGAFLVDPELAGRLREDLVVTLLVALAAVTLTTLCLYPIILSLNRNVVRQSRDLLAGNIELMEVVGTAIAKRDSMTSLHHFRVATYAVRLAEEVGLEGARMGDLIAGAFLHDVGKIGISDNILLKPGSLDADEAEAMKRHVPLRGRHPREVKLADAGARRGRVPPRKVRRQRLRQGPGRRADSADRAHLHRGRCLRCADLEALVQGGGELCRRDHHDP
jgi:hypothetical protein